MDEKRKAGVYGRQSHGKQVSVDDQLREALAVCEREGWEPTTYTDTVSASRFGTKHRGGWSDLVTDVTAGKLDVIVLWDSSRGDRTVSSWAFFLERIRKRGVLVHVIRDQHCYDIANSPRDWKSLHESGTDAAFESEIKSADVRRGVAGKALAGQPHGRPAFGYKRVYDSADRTKFTQVPDANAPTVKAIIEAVAKRTPLVHIVNDLNERGIPAPGGGAWHRNSVRHLVRRPTYAGIRGHNGDTYAGTWEPIVREATWRAAVAVLDDPTRKTTAPGRYRWLLSYLAVCGTCGAHLHGANGSKRRRSSYHCVAKGHVAVGAEALDVFIEELVCARLAREDAQKVFAVDDEQAAQARAAVAVVQAEMDDLADRLAEGSISAMLAGKAEEGIRRRLDAAERELQRHTRHAALASLVDAEDIGRAWDELAVAAKRSVVETLFARIEVGHSGLTLSRWSTFADRVEQAAQRVTVTWA